MPQRCLEEIDSEIKEVHGRTFRKLGSLLIEIVDRKLFQLKGFTNVEDYFNSEPHLPSARQAFRLISATRFSRHLPHTLPQPKSERQVRPLLGRPIEEAKLLWAITTRIAAERKCAVDGKLVAKVVKEFQEGKLESYVPNVETVLNGDGNPLPGRVSRDREEDDSPGSCLVGDIEQCGLKSRVGNQQVRKQERKGGGLLGAPVLPKPQAKDQNDQVMLGGVMGYAQPIARSHSAPSQASSSENACTCCHASSDCQVLTMAQQIAGIVGVLAQAWGCLDESQKHVSANQQPSIPSLSPSLSSLHKAAASQLQCEELQSSSNFGKPYKKGERRDATHERDQCNDNHTSEVATVLRKSHRQLMLMVQQMGMANEPNHTAYPWNFWPQTWSAHPGPVADLRQWYNLTNAGAHTKEPMHVYAGNFGTLVPSTIYRTSVPSTPGPAVATPSLYDMHTIPAADERGIPLIPMDGFPFAYAASHGRSTANGHYSPERATPQMEEKNLIHEAPVPHSLPLPLSGKKRGRNPEGVRGSRLGSARRGKMVRFATPDKCCGLVEAKDDADAQMEPPSRRIDEIMVAEVLVCMSMSCLEEHSQPC